MTCVRCKLEKSQNELNKHSVYKNVQRFICKSCNAERVALQAWKKKHPETIHKTIDNYPQKLSTENEPVYTTIVDSKQQLINERKKIIESIVSKPAVDTMPVLEDDDVQLLSVKDEVVDYYV